MIHIHGSIVTDANLTMTSSVIAPELPTIMMAGIACLVLLGKAGLDYRRRLRVARMASATSQPSTQRSGRIRSGLAATSGDTFEVFPRPTAATNDPNRKKFGNGRGERSDSSRPSSSSRRRGVRLHPSISHRSVKASRIHPHRPLRVPSHSGGTVSPR